MLITVCYHRQWEVCVFVCECERECVSLLFEIRSIPFRLSVMTPYCLIRACFFFLVSFPKWGTSDFTSWGTFLCKGELNTEYKKTPKTFKINERNENEWKNLKGYLCLISVCVWFISSPYYIYEIRLTLLVSGLITYRFWSCPLSILTAPVGPSTRCNR